MSRELGQLKTENKQLISAQKDKKSLNISDQSKKQFEMYKQELKEERERVKNLSIWKSQLSDKNKELKEENDR